MNNKDIDILAVASVLLGMQNLQENRQQSAHNDVQLANDKQAEYLLSEINRRFDEQNKILEELVKTIKRRDMMNKQSAYETAKAEISKTAKDPKDYERQVKELARKMGI